jgi:hypothetical protein
VALKENIMAIAFITVVITLWLGVILVGLALNA